jgi:hypothetical protein
MLGQNSKEAIMSVDRRSLLLSFGGVFLGAPGFVAGLRWLIVDASTRELLVFIGVMVTLTFIILVIWLLLLSPERAP